MTLTVKVIWVTDPSSLVPLVPIVSCRCQRLWSFEYQLTFSLLNPGVMHSLGQQTSSALGSGGPGLFGPYNRDKCFLGSARLTSPPSCILMSSKPAQGPGTPDQPRQAFNTSIYD